MKQGNFMARCRNQLNSLVILTKRLLTTGQMKKLRGRVLCFPIKLTQHPESLPNRGVVIPKPQTSRLRGWPKIVEMTGTVKAVGPDVKGRRMGGTGEGRGDREALSCQFQGTPRLRELKLPQILKPREKAGHILQEAGTKRKFFLMALQKAAEGSLQARKHC